MEIYVIQYEVIPRIKSLPKANTISPARGRPEGVAERGLGKQVGEQPALAAESDGTFPWASPFSKGLCK